MVKRYKMGPIFTPPVVSSLDGPLGTLQVPSDVGGANWPGGSFDPENNFLYIHSHTAVYVSGLVPANPPQSDMGYVAGRRAPGAAARGAAGPRGGPEGQADAAWRCEARRAGARRGGGGRGTCGAATSKVAAGAGQPCRGSR